MPSISSPVKHLHIIHKTTSNIRFHIYPTQYSAIKNGAHSLKKKKKKKLPKIPASTQALFFAIIRNCSCCRTYAFESKRFLGGFQ